MQDSVPCTFADTESLLDQTWRNRAAGFQLGDAVVPRLRARDLRKFLDDEAAKFRDCSPQADGFD